MSAMFLFDITPDGGETFRVPATSRDVEHWERTGKGRSLATLERPQMAHLIEIAFLAASRRGLASGDLAAFRAACDVTPIDPNAVDDDDESGPTQPAP